MFAIVVWLISVLVSIFVIYYLIKIAVRNAISESLEDIRGMISKTICNDRYEHDGKNDKE